jgi:hypothetical protein
MRDRLLFHHHYHLLPTIAVLGALFSLIIFQTAYAQQQAPNKENKGQGQGPPFNQGICITTGNLNVNEQPPLITDEIRELCDKPGQVSNPGECKQILKEFPGVFGGSFTEEDCYKFPYVAPDSHNPNDDDDNGYHG